MPATWLTALKAVLPYVETIVSVATPLFTKKRLEAASSQAEILQQQIAELQAASSQNAENIKELAEQLKKLVLSLEQAATNMESAHARLRALAMAAIAISTAALTFVLLKLH